jgi:sigma-B regulation protein RsbU (phosphoserine phosphatase)
MSDQPAQHMQCMEVWSGSQLTESSVEFGGLDAWVYSKPFGDARRGGDVYYASSCATGRITRLLLADVSGHGSAVADTATRLRTLMRQFVNRLDQAEFVRLLNRQFAELSQGGTFATAIVATFFAPTGRLTVCNAGHPRPVVYRASQRAWNLLSSGAQSDVRLRNIPLGMIALAEYEQFDVELEPGDCLLCYSDALIESCDAAGEPLREAGLLRIVRGLGDLDAQDITGRLLKEIAARDPTNLSEDDVTVLIVRANGRAAYYPFGQKLRALGRFVGALLRAVHPQAERPPLPDANLANIGGAIMPALSRRWRRQT